MGHGQSFHVTNGKARKSQSKGCWEDVHDATVSRVNVIVIAHTCGEYHLISELRNSLFKPFEGGEKAITTLRERQVCEKNTCKLDRH